MTSDAVTAFLAVGGTFPGKGMLGDWKSICRSVRSIKLVHYAPNELGFTTWEVQYKVCRLPAEVVKRMNRLGMLIDVLRIL